MQPLAFVVSRYSLFVCPFNSVVVLSSWTDGFRFLFFGFSGHVQINSRFLVILFDLLPSSVSALRGATGTEPFDGIVGLRRRRHRVA